MRKYLGSKTLVLPKAWIYFKYFCETKVSLPRQMLKKFILLAVLLNCLNAGIVDEFKLFNANRQYKKSHFKKALNEYLQIEPKNDTVYFNIANCYYRLGKYQKAIDYYRLIKEPKLNAKKLYNIGNAYVMQKNYLKAVLFYKNALRFSKDKKIKENLKYAQKRLIIMQDIMLSQAKCAATFKELDNFDDENVSKDLKEAKYKKVQKFNITNSLYKRTDDFAESLKSDANKTKTVNQHELEINRAGNRLKEKNLRTILIPIEK